MTKEIPGRTMLKKNITPERALAEFRVAVEIWLGYMDERRKVEALVLVTEKIERDKEKINQTASLH